jgi:hypothetical protein
MRQARAMIELWSQIHVADIAVISNTGGRNHPQPRQRKPAHRGDALMPTRSICSTAARCVRRALSTSVRGHTSHPRLAEER